MPLGPCAKKQYQSDIPCIIQQGIRFVKKRQGTVLCLFFFKRKTGIDIQKRQGTVHWLLFFSKEKNGSRHPMPAPGGFCYHGIAVREYQGDICVLPEDICLLSADPLFLCGKPVKRLRACHMIAPITPSSPITPVITVSPVSQITGRVPWPSAPGQPCCRP